jgi:hypothetical protein
MKDPTGRKVVILNPGVAKGLKASVYDLSEAAAKQVLYGIIQIFSVRANMSSSIFEEVIDDAVRYSKVKEGR